MITTTPAPSNGDERRALPKMPDLRYHAEYRRGFAACLTELQSMAAAQPVAQPATMRDLLEEAFAGLQWYRDMHPEDDSSADDEMFARIESALAASHPSQGAEMIEVTKEDGNNYCRILSLLGMEEEGDPVAEVQRLMEPAAAPHPPVSAEAGKGVEEQLAESISLDFRQATDLLAMFGGEPTEITLMTGNGHSGPGLYAVYNADPEGSVYLGESDEEAVPEPSESVSGEVSDTERLDWIIDHATTHGGGQGFTLTVFIPHDSECVRTSIDAVLALAGSGGKR